MTHFSFIDKRLVVFISATLLLFMLSCDDRDEYVPAPVIVSFQPQGASPGQPFVIFGGNFSKTTAENSVTINGVTASVQEAATNRLVVLVPDDATDGVLAVTVNAQTGVAPSLFDVHNTLEIKEVSPKQILRLDTLTIKGTYFGATAAENIVKIQDMEATVISASHTEIKVIVPLNSSIGDTTVSLSANGQTATSSSFEIIDYPPFEFTKALDAPTSEDLKKVSVANENIAYAVGDSGTIMKRTADDSWEDISYGTLSFRDVHAIDAEHVLACGYDGMLIKTNDGGTSWTEVSVGTTENLRRMHFISETEGWLVGSDGVMFKTTDGGDTWQSLTSGVSVSLYGVFFVNKTLGFAVGKDDHVLKTTDGGATWTTNVLNTNEDLNSIVFKDENTGWITGKDNVLMATTDGGNTWTNQSISLDSSGDDFNDIVMVSETNIIAVADDHQLAVSEDSGNTWAIIDLEAKLSTPISDHFEGVDAYAGKAIVVGEKGIVAY